MQEKCITVCFRESCNVGGYILWDSGSSTPWGFIALLWQGNQCIANDQILVSLLSGAFDNSDAWIRGSGLALVSVFQHKLGWIQNKSY